VIGGGWVGVRLLLTEAGPLVTGSPGDPGPNEPWFPCPSPGPLPTRDENPMTSGGPHRLMVMTPGAQSRLGLLVRAGLNPRSTRAG
jgi:hypothetical protein